MTLRRLYWVYKPALLLLAVALMIVIVRLVAESANGQTADEVFRPDPDFQWCGTVVVVGQVNGGLDVIKFSVAKDNNDPRSHFGGLIGRSENTSVGDTIQCISGDMYNHYGIGSNIVRVCQKVSPDACLLQ